MKIRLIGIGNDNKEYTNNETINTCDFPCIMEYEKSPSKEQLKEHAFRVLAILELGLPTGVEIVKARYELIQS